MNQYVHLSPWDVFTSAHQVSERDLSIGMHSVIPFLVYY